MLRLNRAAAAVAPPPAAESLVVQANPDADPWGGHAPGDCAGVDEVGRGCLFGPVYAGAVVLAAGAIAPLQAHGLTDSKKLSPQRRAALVPLIQRNALAWAIGQASAGEIDRFGIRAATERAMHRALTRLPFSPPMLLVDGVLPLRGWSGEQLTLVAGDLRNPAIAAASVLAKEARDAHLRRLARRYPGYGLERHMGYGTAAHRQAILQQGITPLHRRSFLGRLLGRADSQDC